MLAPGEEPLINTTAYTNYGSLSREGSATGWGEAILRPAHSAVSYGIGYGISTSKSVLTTRQDTRKKTESELLTNNYNFQGTGYFYLCHETNGSSLLHWRSHCTSRCDKGWELIL